MNRPVNLKMLRKPSQVTLKKLNRVAVKGRRVGQSLHRLASQQAEPAQKGKPRQRIAKNPLPVAITISQTSRSTISQTSTSSLSNHHPCPLGQRCRRWSASSLNSSNICEKIHPANPPPIRPSPYMEGQVRTM